MREFKTGATRDSDETKNDYDGFLDPIVIERYGNYMTKHRKQADGKLRDSNNWKKGIPKEAYMKSMWRHFLDVWFIHTGYKRFDKQRNEEITMDEALCALLFNIMGYLFEILKPKVDTEQERINRIVMRKEDRPFIEKGKCNINHPTFVNTTCDLGYACDCCPYFEEPIKGVEDEK